ncbi:hypothetical protein HYALB_00011886 [Hymenoscyphus albidus]|uniref:Acyl-CoA dehydrogenase/oxidase N-terminal domain-containing protein n=1 Tax=Hymenoscyphus albidus TaxID=595503 RepID=A0A9N9Q457_9HELO|nr:hypothetical protein HYALB_00011886 [Hymenoscyphus albidus]
MRFTMSTRLRLAKPVFTGHRIARPRYRYFSTTSSLRANTLMETSGFSDTQLQVREAIGKICMNFSDEYWAQRDESGEYPHELHAALAKDGWIGIALPEDLGGSGTGHLRSDYDATYNI